MTGNGKLSFEPRGHWRAWREWPGVMALATGFALWLFLGAGVVGPLANALRQLNPPEPPAATADVREVPSAGDEAFALRAAHREKR